MTAAMMKFLADHVTPRPPAATMEAVGIAVRSKALSSEKSRRELGYTPRPIEPALQEAIEGIPGGSRWSVAGWRAALKERQGHDGSSKRHTRNHLDRLAL